MFIFLTAVSCFSRGESLPWNATGEAGKETTVLFISDIHFDPFSDGAAKELEKTDIAGWRAVLEGAKNGKFPDYGKDTNYALLSSSLAEINKAGAGAGCVIVCGDMLCHRFDVKYRLNCNPAGSEAPFAIKTIGFLAAMIKEALPGKPVFYVIGNNDSDKGDYNIIPGGAMLTALPDYYDTIAPVKAAASDFKKGGYYELPLPGLDKCELIVLNDVYWHKGYKRPRRVKETAGDVEMKWLKSELDTAAAAGKKVFIAMHIPPGIDPYMAAKDKGCKGPDGFMLPEYNSEFIEMIRSHGMVVKNIFAGHTHFDDFRIFSDAGNPFMAVSIIPSISPVHGNNPAFEMAIINSSGEIKDRAVYNMGGYGAGTGASAWGLEYTFCAGYGISDLSPAGMNALAASISAPGAAQDKYYSFYTAGNTLLSILLKKQSAVYDCALVSQNFEGFAACGCGGR
jgi:hypothetical protein